jgi:hypothetical protein
VTFHQTQAPLDGAFPYSRILNKKKAAQPRRPLIDFCGMTAARDT